MRLVPLIEFLNLSFSRGPHLSSQVLQSSSPSYVLMASLDAARQQVQQQRRHDYGDDESFVVRGMRLATDARRLLRQLPPLRVLDGANLQPPSCLSNPCRPHQRGSFSSACCASWALSGYPRISAERGTRGAPEESGVASCDEPWESIHNVSRIPSAHRRVSKPR